MRVQLERWQLSETNLPPDTIVSFKEPTLWEQHLGLILSAIAVIAFESALIAALLIQFLRRRRAEGSLKESEERWRSVFETSAAGVAVMDGNASFVATNAAFQSMVGYPDEELRGLSLVDLSVADERESSRQLVDELRQGTRRHYDAVKQFQGRNAAPVWGHIYLSTIPGDDAKPRLFIATTIDITARKLAEDAMRIAQSELAQVARLTTMGEMTASIAHEINQPLAAIVANGNAGLRWLANTTPDIDEVRATLKRIVSDGHRAGRVISGLRTMFKKNSQGNTAVDVNDLVREVLALVRGELDNRRVSVRTELEQLPQVLVDRVQLQQVILNLIMNARDAMASVDGRARVLRLRTERHEPGGIMVSVQDSGTGIGKRDMDRIFEPFFTTKPHGNGNGAVDLPVDRRSPWRTADGVPRPSLRLGLSSDPADPGARHGPCRAGRRRQSSHRGDGAALRLAPARLIVPRLSAAIPERRPRAKLHRQGMRRPAGVRVKPKSAIRLNGSRSYTAEPGGDDAQT